MKSLIFTAESILGLQRALRGEPGGKFQTRRKISKRLIGDIPLDQLSANLLLLHSPIQPGDVVRAKEAWGVEGAALVDPCLNWRADGGQQCLSPDIKYLPYIGEGWRSPMFMPQWASRYFLPITAVRVERLQGISEADARAEGIYLPTTIEGLGKPLGKGGNPGWTYDGVNFYGTARHCYECEFDRINGKGAWDANPWVAVYGWSAVLTEEPQAMKRIFRKSNPKRFGGRTITKLSKDELYKLEFDLQQWLRDTRKAQGYTWRHLQAPEPSLSRRRWASRCAISSSDRPESIGASGGSAGNSPICASLLSSVFRTAGRVRRKPAADCCCLQLCLARRIGIRTSCCFHPGRAARPTMTIWRAIASSVAGKCSRQASRTAAIRPGSAPAPGCWLLDAAGSDPYARVAAADLDLL